MTVGIVVVSHSATLAEAAAELAREMTSDELRIALAAGIDDPEQPLGTDATRVLAALEELDGEDGVLVLMDLGSAVLSAELARDLLEEEQAARVLLCEAPLVEGLVAAAVQAAAGADLASVAAEARNGLAAKRAQLGVSADQPPAPTAPVAQEAPAASARLPVPNALGIHARPAARIVGAVGAFAAQVTIANPSTGRGPVSASSLNGLITLGARHGHELEVRASGPDAAAAVAALEALAGQDYGDAAPAEGAARPAEAAAPGASAEAVAPGALHGRSAAPGLAIGPVAHLARTSLPAAGTSDRVPGTAAEEGARLEAALATATDRIAATRRSLLQRADADAAAILDAHLLLLADPALLEPARAGIGEGASAERAWAAAITDVIGSYAALDDAYLAARAADVEAVGEEVLAALQGDGEATTAARGVVVGRDLPPSAAARLDSGAVDAIVLAGGSPTSHTAVLARALGIPAVVAAGPDVLGLSEGTQLVVDGDTGRVLVDPDPSTLADVRREIASRRARAAQARRAAAAPAVTADGTTVEVRANVGLARDAARAHEEGADGIGLLRSELLFLDRPAAPDEDEQVAAYRGVCDAVPGLPVTLRTLDVGGDKPLRYLEQQAEANPFLGERGIRLSLRRPALLAAQLRAALRVAADRPLQVMIPMASTVGELEEVGRLLDEARAGLAAEGVAVPERVPLGAMVEVPALALNIGHVLPHVDFLSVGTNDLTQYVLAAERGNPAVAHLGDALDPAVLRLLAGVCEAAAGSGTPVAVCGGLASEPLAVGLLLGLGVRELSVPPPAVPEIKARVRATELEAAAALAGRALALRDAAAVRRLLAAAG